MSYLFLSCTEEKDSNNLYFRVQTSGKKSWQLRYKTNENKWTWLGLGSYPETSAVRAREKAMEITLRKSNGEEVGSVDIFCSKK